MLSSLQPGPARYLVVVEVSPLEPAHVARGNAVARGPPPPQLSTEILEARLPTHGAILQGREGSECTARRPFSLHPPPCSLLAASDPFI